MLMLVMIMMMFVASFFILNNKNVYLLSPKDRMLYNYNDDDSYGRLANHVRAAKLDHNPMIIGDIFERFYF